MRRFQRIISVLLILVSCVTWIPAAALADEEIIEDMPVAETELAAPAGEAEVSAETAEAPAEEEELSADALSEPVAADAAAAETGDDESDEIIVETELATEGLSVPASYYADNDDLFAEYVEYVMSFGESAAYTASRAARKSAGASLTDLSATVYTLLREKIAQIAAGKETSTEILFSREELGIENEKYTAEQLGVSALVTTVNGQTSITSEAQDALKSKYAERLAFSQVLYALLADCPYELYWFDKTVGIKYGYGYSCNGSEVCVFQIQYNFAVSAGYSATGEKGTYVTNGAGATVEKARSNAAAIVAKHASEGDYDKLYSYLEEICDLTEYNTPASTGGINYGDPWQLVWVFDGDDTTTVVCEGYSKAFQYLCELSSFRGAVDCISVSGDMSSSTGGGGPHMWNVVTIDGENYLTDITNCDGKSVGAPDQLFLAGASGSVESGYKVTLSRATVTYTYDQKACSVFDRADLVLAGQSYTAPTVYGGIKYKFKNWQARIVGYTSDLPGEVIIPDTVEGCVVRTIDDSAFSGASGITAVTIPAGVNTIKSKAFSGCSALKTVTFLGKAPTVANDAFGGVKAAVRYYADDTWTDAARVSYGGTLTWQGVLKGTNGAITASLNGGSDWDSGASISMEKMTTVTPALETAIQKEASAGNIMRYVAYDLSLGAAPQGSVTVTLQAPTGFGSGSALYRVESDGSLTEMATYANGGFTFTTEHFSTYIVARERVATLTKGDINGDKGVSLADAIMIAQNLVGLLDFDAEETSAADLDGDGKVGGLDAVLAAQVAVGAISIK